MIRVARHMVKNIWKANDNGIRGKLLLADIDLE